MQICTTSLELVQDLRSSGFGFPHKELVPICTTSPEINKLHPPRDSKQLGGLACIHETMSRVDEHIVHDSVLCLPRTQGFTSIKSSPNHIISYWPSYTIKLK
jgi:hypothetical protein